MKHSHTPGPWMIQDVARARDISSAGGRICRMPRRLARHDANARLILAAPGMLEALEAIQTYMNENPNLNAEKIIDVVYNIAGQAITKARGES